MPGGDRTGPRGMGPLTGRHMGYCAGYATPGYTNPGPGYGPGMGYGRGMGWGRGGYGGGGRGWRNMYYATGLPGWARAGFVRKSLGWALKNSAADVTADTRAKLRIKLLTARVRLAEAEGRLNRWRYRLCRRLLYHI